MQAQWTCWKGNLSVGSQAPAHLMVFKSVRVCSMLFYPGLIYAWQGALGFFFLFNLWLYSVGTWFPVKPEKEGLLCAACCVCQVLLLFLFLLLSYIKKLSNSWLLGCLSDSVCSDTKVYLTARPPHQSPLERWFRTLPRAAGPAGRLTYFYISWDLAFMVVCNCNSLEEEPLWCFGDILLDSFRMDN